MTNIAVFMRSSTFASCGQLDEVACLQMYFDDLPIWGFVGKVEKIGQVFTYYLFTHFHFDVAYNDNRIISIDSSADPKTVRDISFDGEQTVEFTYSVKWVPTVEKVRTECSHLAYSHVGSVLHATWAKMQPLLPP